MMNKLENKPLQFALEFVESTATNIFLTGKAGTGKTTFLRNLKEKSPKRMIVVAPTGVAAINAGGVTMHSFFQLSFGPQVGNKDMDPRQMRFSKVKINIIRSLDLVVIDEISMVRADILDAIDAVLRRFRRSSKPFGGVQLLMIGDLQQLSPVIKDNEWQILKSHYETGYFFSSNALQKTSYISIELKHVYRQKDKDFIDLLNNIRTKQLSTSDLKRLNQRYLPDFNALNTDDYITLCTHNYQANRINEQHLSNLNSKSIFFEAKIEGNFPDHSFPTEQKLELKEGAQVMFIKNDPNPEKLFYNGKIGRIETISEHKLTVVCPGNERIHVSPLEWKNLKYSIDLVTAEIKENTEGTFSQIPLKLAWAVTIHKSQGLTFDNAIIDAEASFAHGQVYVALSRCRTLEGMVLKTPISESSIINDKTVEGFTDEIDNNQPNKQQLIQAQHDYQHQIVDDIFDYSNLQISLFSVLKTIRLNSASFPETISQFFRKMQDKFQLEIKSVSDRFRIQIKELVQKEPNINSNPILIQRMNKAATYFDDKMSSIILEPLSKTDIEIDNTTINKKLNQFNDQILEECHLKKISFESMIKGFDIKSILQVRARAIVEKNQVKTAKTKKIYSYDELENPQLYSELKSWRQAKAAEMNVPVFMILSQKSMYGLVNELPRTEKALNLVHGIGTKKVKQFGYEILEIINAYCIDYGIQKTSVEPKSNEKKNKRLSREESKQLSYRLFTSGKVIDEIAQVRNMSKNTIAQHLGDYIASGHIDISVFVNKHKVAEISQFFKDKKTKSLKAAKDELGDNISYEEIRFVLYHLDHLADQL